MNSQHPSNDPIPSFKNLNERMKEDIENAIGQDDHGIVNVNLSDMGGGGPASNAADRVIEDVTNLETEARTKMDLSVERMSQGSRDISQHDAEDIGSDIGDLRSAYQEGSNNFAAERE